MPQFSYSNTLQIICAIPAHIQYVTHDNTSRVFYLFANADKHCRRNLNGCLKLHNKSFYLLDLNLHLMYLDLGVRVRVILHDPNQHCEVHNLLHINRESDLKHLNLQRIKYSNIRKNLHMLLFSDSGFSFMRFFLYLADFQL